MLFVQTVTKSGPIEGGEQMELEDQIREILFKLGQEIKIHKLDLDNIIIEIDYDKATAEIVDLLKNAPGKTVI
jgi:predicted HAD superfamily phosphohydrolase YqeG